MLIRPQQSIHKIVALVLRRMRAPLIVLISAYAVSVLGLVLIPGVDDQGNPWHMSFFHAFYFVSYMGTTIGFGEIPYPFTDGQRMWTTLCVYLTVIAWLYAIGKLLALAQDSALRRAVTENRFYRSVKQIREPFYLVCGYGDTGSLVTRALTQRGLRAVVIDINQDRINELLLTDLDIFVPGLCADAGTPSNLCSAGLKSPHCVGVIALTDRDHTNLEIAISGKLLNPDLKVICRAETEATQTNMASFGTDHIINPFEAFGEEMATALHSPELHMIYDWLTQLPRTPLSRHKPPPQGRWILCGYGRFGRAMEKHLQRQGVSTTIVEADPAGTHCEGRCIVGKGTEAVTLLAADVKHAAGIVAGTDDDADNLSILMTARELQPDLYTVARQNKRSNDMVFAALKSNHVMQHSEVVTLRVLALVTAPLLDEFLRLLQQQGNDLARELAPRIEQVADNIVPDIWTLDLNYTSALAVTHALENGRPIQLGHLTRDPRDREQALHCLPLLLKRGDHSILLPGPDEQIEMGDRILLCGRYGTSGLMAWTLENHNALRYIETGETRPDGYVWRWFARQQ
jgi:voltage-gated potassium channel